MNQSDQQFAVALLEECLRNEQYNYHTVNGLVVVQLHSLPDEFKTLATTLVEAGYSFEVHGEFEVPPKLEIHSRHWPEQEDVPVEP